MGSQDQNGYRFHREAMRPLSLPELISKKRDGRPFSKEEVQLFVDSVTDKSMQECQIGKARVKVLSNCSKTVPLFMFARCMHEVDK